MLGIRHQRIAWVAAVAAIALIAATVAVGAPSEVRTFAPAGDGPGGIGPHASGLAVAPNGTIYIADRHEGRVEVYANDGAPARAFGELDGPTALALDGDRLLVGDAEGVHSFAAAGGRHLESLGGPASPGGIAVGSDGTVYATDPANGHLAVIGGGAIGAAELVAPVGVAVGPDGDLFVADPGTDTVKRFTPAGEAKEGLAAEDPHGLAFAPDGTLYVAESQSHQVARFEPDIGLRRENLGGSLNVPRGVAVDCRGSVYVIDNSDPRGHVFAEPGTAAPPCLAPPPPPAQEVHAEVREAEPEVGRTTRATVLRGSVVVGKGKSRRNLTGRAILPIGEQIDVGNGLVRLEFEAIGPDRDKYGRLMDAEFDSGEFTIHQGRNDSLVEVVLQGTSRQQAQSSLARAAAKRKRRRVWTRARGRFRTRGNHGAATVMGTHWLTEERKRGTFFRVTEGAITVTSFLTGRTKVVRAPGTYLAKAPCVSRRRFRIRLRPPVGTTVRSVSVRLDGRRIPVRRGKRLTALIDLRGRPKGRVVVRIKVRTADGRVVRGIRDYHTCQKPRRGDIPEL